MITEAGIRAALKVAPTSGKNSIELRDDAERGAGRLMLTIRPTRDRIISEWYAVWYRDEKRRKLKIGVYPLMPLATARKTFREEYAPTISAGADPENKHVRRRHKGPAGAATVEELFRAYVEHLKESGKRSWSRVEHMLLSPKLGAAKVIGVDRLASSVTTGDCVAHLAAIHERGAVVMADTARAYLHSAFAFGMKAAHDYTKKEVSATNWGIKVNPVESIQTDTRARRAGNRYLSPAEVKVLWDWWVTYKGNSRAIPAVQLVLLTGQRVEEILRISETVYLPDERMLYWQTTKNRLPHSIPLPTLAIEILNSLTPNEHGLYFPHRDHPDRPAPYRPLWVALNEYIAETGAERFTPRNFRRTFKTLAGDAGISKDMRDRLQNHVKSGDVSSRHYDRYDYLPEKKAAMEKWEAYFAQVIVGKISKLGERDNVVAFKPAVVA